MNDTGKNIVDGFRELRKFCHQASLLLKTAKGMMEGKGWNVTKPSAVFYSYRAINDPDWWLPYEFCRFFKNSDFPRLLSYIAINLEDPEESSPVEYALLSAGCIVFEQGKKHAPIKHWMSRWHCYTPNRIDDGTLCIDEPQKTWKAEDGYEPPPAGVSTVTTFAYPLTDICDCEKLKEQIVKPLMKVLEKEATVSKTKTT